MYINIIDTPNFQNHPKIKWILNRKIRFPREVDGEAVEMCPKVACTCDRPSEDSMEVT